MVGECLVCAKIKDQQGLMKDKVGENYEYEVRFSLKKANEKMTKCTTNDPFVVHLYHKVGNLYHKSGAFYYINVPQIGGGEKMYHIVALVGEKAEFWGHSTTLN